MSLSYLYPSAYINLLYYYTSGLIVYWDNSASYCVYVCINVCSKITLSLFQGSVLINTSDLRQLTHAKLGQIAGSEYFTHDKK